MGVRGKRVLVVEDDEDVKDLTSQLLTKAGATVDSCSNGLEAEQFLAGQQEYDLVVTDLVMPEISGLQLIADIRKSKKHATLPVVVVSGALDDEGAKKIASLPHVTVVRKPFSAADLAVAVEAVTRPAAMRFVPKKLE